MNVFCDVYQVDNVDTVKPPSQRVKRKIIESQVDPNVKSKSRQRESYHWSDAEQ
jgi:hypothetical protein